MALDQLIAGDTLDFLDNIPDYPPADGWTLKYRLTPLFTTPTQAPIVLTAATSGTQYSIQASPATTALWSAGRYSWGRWVEKTGARQTLEPITPFLEVVADPATTAQGYDPRTTAEIALEDAQTALASFQSTGGRVKSYSIAGRSMEFDSAGDLVELVGYWKAEVMRERATKAKRGGAPDPRRITVRMSNA